MSPTNDDFLDLCLHELRIREHVELCVAPNEAMVAFRDHVTVYLLPTCIANLFVLVLQSVVDEEREAPVAYRLIANRVFPVLEPDRALLLEVDRVGQVEVNEHVAHISRVGF